jgi:predicted O-methyltransferase YrrM
MLSHDEIQALEPKIEQLISGLDGWCTPHKGAVLYKLASDAHVKTGLEIGIFAGKSMFPVCLAFKDKGHGKHYGVEPWSAEVATETVTNEVNDEWWSKLDFPAIKLQFFSNLIRFGLLPHAGVVESASDSAYALFSTYRFRQKIDLLHIDGAHSTPESLHDVTNWTKLVRPSGYVVLDDINWPSVELAYTYLKTLGEEIYSAATEENGYFSVVRIR